MMKKTAVVLIILLGSAYGYCQKTGEVNIVELKNKKGLYQPGVFSKFEYAFTTGYGSYLMSDLIAVQKVLSGQIPLNVQLTTQFPPYVNYSFRYGERNGDGGFAGIKAGFMSTGARSSIADYSGYYYSDINCQAIHTGYYQRKRIKKYHFMKIPFETGYQWDISMIYSIVTLKENLKIYGLDDEINGSNTLNSLGFYTEPELYLKGMFTKWLGLEVNAGGAISVSNGLYYQKMSNEVTIDGKKRYANWSGFRISAGVVMIF